MSTNLIDQMPEREAKEILNDLASMLELSASSRVKDAFIIAVNSLLIEAGYKVKVTSFEQGKSIYCSFKGYSFELEKDDDNYGNWYAVVRASDGAIDHDGWIDDSSSIGPIHALEQAADGAMIVLVHGWKEQVMEQINESTN
jgi:hypothetical protein